MVHFPVLSDCHGLGGARCLARSLGSYCDAFAGEGVLETIHPDERRLLSYAGDAAIHVKYSDDSSDSPFSHIQNAEGVM
jgi:hypothetical protein